MKSARIELIIAALLALAAIGGYAFWYMSVSAKEAEVASLSEQVAAKEASGARSAEARGEAAGLMEQAAYVSSRILLPADAVSFLESLEKTGKSYGAAVKVASVDDSKKSAGTITISLSINGSFDAVERTLGALEHGTPAATAKSMTFTSQGEGTWSAVGTLTVLTPITSSP